MALTGIMDLPFPQGSIITSRTPDGGRLFSGEIPPGSFSLTPREREDKKDGHQTRRGCMTRAKSYEDISCRLNRQRGIPSAKKAPPGVPAALFHNGSDRSRPWKTLC